MEPNLSEYITEYHEEKRYNTDWDEYYENEAEKADEEEFDLEEELLKADYCNDKFDELVDEMEEKKWK